MSRTVDMNYLYLTSMWTIELYIRRCDICKILGLKFVPYIARLSKKSENGDLGPLEYNKIR